MGSLFQIEVGILDYILKIVDSNGRSLKFTYNPKDGEILILGSNVDVIFISVPNK